MPYLKLRRSFLAPATNCAPAAVRHRGPAIGRTLPSQADDIGAHGQQNGYAQCNDDQEEFSHVPPPQAPTQNSENGSPP
jgi:hypothetical protein